VEAEAGAGTVFVRVFDAPSLPLAEVAKSKLESEGIQVMVKGATAYAYPAGPLQLWVPREQRSRARAILDEVAGGGLELAGDDGAGGDG
jgi:Putative prokaryotic signal transducing protein